MFILYPIYTQAAWVSVPNRINKPGYSMNMKNIIDSIMAMDVSDEAWLHPKKRKEILTTLRSIRDGMANLLYPLHSIIQGRGQIAEQDDIEPTLVAMIMLPNDQLQALYHKLETIDEQTKYIQQCQPLGILHTAVYRKIQDAPVQDKHVHLANLVDLNTICETHIAIAKEKIITQLKCHGIAIDIPPKDSSPEVMKQYYVKLAQTIAIYAERDPYIKLYQQQHSAFYEIQTILFDAKQDPQARYNVFHTMLGEYMDREDPVPLQELTLCQLRNTADNHQLFLEIMMERTTVFKNEVRATMDAELKRRHFYTSFDEFCRQNRSEINENDDEATRYTELLKCYESDRENTINIVSTHDPKFYAIYEQYQEICRLEKTLTKPNSTAVERRASFERQVLDNIDVLTHGNESAAKRWLKGIFVFFATLVTLPALGLGGYLAYRGLYSPTPGRRFVKDLNLTNQSLTEPLLGDDSLTLSDFSLSPRAR